MKRQLKTTKAKRDRAVSLIQRGESTIEEQALRLQVKPRAVKAWLTMAQNGTRQGRRSAEEIRATGGEPDFSRAESTKRLEDALGAAGLDGGAPGDEPAANGEADASDVPPPDPAALVAMVETVRGMALKLSAAVVGVDPDDARASSLFTFTEPERATLGLWAPYAAKYVPLLVRNQDEVGAWAFVGVTAASTWSAMAALRRLAPAPEPRAPSDRFRGPGDPPPRPQPGPGKTYMARGTTVATSEGTSSSAAPDERPESFQGLPETQ